MRAQTRAGRPRGAAPADRGTLQASDNTAQPGATAHPIRRQLFLGRAVSRRVPFAVRIGVGSIVLELQKQHNVVDFAALDRIVSGRHRVIVYSHIATDEVILTALDRGAVTYLTKSESKDHLIDAIRAAGTDTPYAGPRMALAMLNDSTVGRANLALREIKVLIAWFRTESKDLVARQLQIAPTTVRTHLQRVRAKYAAVGRPATTKTALVARAIQDGIVNVHDI